MSEAFLFIYCRGALEPQFYQQLLIGLGLENTSLPNQMDKQNWPKLRAIFEQRFAQRTRDQWDEIFTGKDACVVSVRPITSPTFDLRPIVSLSDTPARKIDASWSGTLPFGKGDTAILSEWLGWREHVDFSRAKNGSICPANTKSSKL